MANFNGQVWLARVIPALFGTIYFPTAPISCWLRRLVPQFQSGYKQPPSHSDLYDRQFFWWLYHRHLRPSTLKCRCAGCSVACGRCLELQPMATSTNHNNYGIWNVRRPGCRGDIHICYVHISIQKIGEPCQQSEQHGFRLRFSPRRYWNSVPQGWHVLSLGRAVPRYGIRNISTWGCKYLKK